MQTEFKVEESCGGIPPPQAAQDRSLRVGMTVWVVPVGDKIQLWRSWIPAIAGEFNPGRRRIRGCARDSILRARRKEERRLRRAARGRGRASRRRGRRRAPTEGDQ